MPQWLVISALRRHLKGLRIASTGQGTLRTCVGGASAATPVRNELDPPGKPKAGMKTYDVSAPFERIAVDTTGPLTESDRGKKYILVISDYFTKWTEAYTLPNREAVTVA